MENVGCSPVCSPARCVAAQFGHARDFLVIPTLAAVGLAQARLNSALEYGIFLRKYFHLRIKIYY